MKKLLNASRLKDRAWLIGIGAVLLSVSIFAALKFTEKDGNSPTQAMTDAEIAKLKELGSRWSELRNGDDREATLTLPGETTLSPQEKAIRKEKIQNWIKKMKYAGLSEGK